MKMTTGDIIETIEGVNNVVLHLPMPKNKEWAVALYNAQTKVANALHDLQYLYEFRKSKSSGVEDKKK